MMAIVNPSRINTEALGHCVAQGPAGAKIKLNQFWNKQTAIFIFLRHFACIACRAHATQVWKEREKYESTGGKLVFVGNGQPHFIDKFREDLGIEGALIVTDPTREIFKRAGFKKGFFYVVQPASVVNAVRLAVAGHKQTSYSEEAGTHWQLGGILAVSQKGKVLYHYISESLGDFPEDEQLQFLQ